MSMIDSRLADALKRASKLERRAETAINDGKVDKACIVLADLRKHASRHMLRAEALAESLEACGYSQQGYNEYAKDLRAFRTYATERLEQLKGPTGK